MNEEEEEGEGGCEATMLEKINGGRRCWMKGDMQENKD